MPCSDPTGPEIDLAYMRLDLDRATRAACEAIKALTTSGIALSHLSKETQKWWRLHQVADRTRREDKIRWATARVEDLEGRLEAAQDVLENELDKE